MKMSFHNDSSEPLSELSVIELHFGSAMFLQVKD